MRRKKPWSSIIKQERVNLKSKRETKNKKQKQQKEAKNQNPPKTSAPESSCYTKENKEMNSRTKRTKQNPKKKGVRVQKTNEKQIKPEREREEI